MLKMSLFVRKILAIILIICMLFILSSSSLAASKVHFKKTEQFTVEDGILTPISRTAYERAVTPFSTGSTTSNAVSLTTETIVNPTQRVITLGLEGMEKLATIKDKLAIANYVLQQLDYPEERIAAMDENTKLAYAPDGPLVATVSHAVINEDGSSQYFNSYAAAISSTYPTSSSNARGVASTTLSYTQGSASNIWTVTLDSWYNALSTNMYDIIYHPSIAVQNCHIPSISAYLRYSINGEAPFTAQTYSMSDFRDMSDQLSGNGYALDVHFPASTYVSQKSDFQIVLTATVLNSSVVPGGAFGIYGNFPTTTLRLASPSISYPWGVSAEIVASAIDLKTQLTAFYNPGSGGILL